MEARQIRNISIAPSFDFFELLRGAVAMISHGGQNSLMQCLLYGVPMISIPGGVRERRFNAAALESLHAGKLLEVGDFLPANLLSLVREYAVDRSYRESSRKAGEQLRKLGGAEKMLGIMEQIVGEKP
jgi:UDP:flavonoid glycosyltransferase YjiC (YdhE family)